MSTINNKKIIQRLIDNGGKWDEDVKDSIDPVPHSIWTYTEQFNKTEVFKLIFEPASGEKIHYFFNSPSVSNPWLLWTAKDGLTSRGETLFTRKKA